MGLKNWAHNRRMSDPVPGTLQLTSCSANSGGAAYENCRMQGVVVAERVGPVAVEHTCMAPTSRWPSPGGALPVTVDRADPTRLRVEWDEVPTGREQGRRLAEDLAASMGGRTPGVSPVEVTTTVVGAPGRAVPGATGGGLTPEQAAAAAGNSAMQRASARVLAVHEVQVPPGMPGGGAAGTVDITLDVAPADGQGWTTTMRIAFSTPEKRARVATVGTVLPVLINPRAHDQVAVDTARLS